MHAKVIVINKTYIRYLDQFEILDDHLIYS